MAKAKSNNDPRDILARNRQEALAFANRAGRERAIALLSKAQTKLAERLRQAEGLQNGADRFSAQRLKIALGQVKLTMRELTGELRSVLMANGKLAAVPVIKNLVSYMQASEQKFKGIGHALQLKPAMMLDRVAMKTEASVLARIEGTPDHPGRRGVLARYGADVVTKFEERLQMGLLTEESWDDVRKGVIEESSFLKGAPRYWAERIVRTETMAAYNRASLEGVREAQKELGDCVKILVATFDDRTGWDSYQVHGQIRRPEEPFEWSKGSFMYPPNRPNDRETVITHRLSWPIPPELEPKSDGEVEARYRQLHPKGPGPGARPNMSTVDRSLFGKVEEPTTAPVAEQEPEETTAEPETTEKEEHRTSFWRDKYKHLGEASESVAHGRAALERGLDMPIDEVFAHDTEPVMWKTAIRDEARAGGHTTLRSYLKANPEWEDAVSVLSAFAGHIAKIKKSTIVTRPKVDTDEFYKSAVDKRVDEAHAFMSKMCDVKIVHSRPYYPLKLKVRGSNTRAFYQGGKNTITIGGNTGNHVITHEWGHALEENNKALGKRALSFLEARTKNEKSVRLRELFPDRNYDSLEWTKRDKFMEPYVGKQYPDGATEVTSMGVEYLIQKPRDFYNQDKEHFFFTLGQLAGTGLP